MNKEVFIVADDLGIHSLINDGIIYCLKNNLISGASLMANGEGTSDAINKVKSFPAHLNIGIHFTFVEEKPLTSKKFPSNYKEFFIKYILGKINLKDVEEELRAQINLLKNSGIRISFINSHQHLHLLPGITDIVIKLAKENNIDYIRTISEPWSMKGGLSRGLQSIFLSILSNITRKKIKEAHLSTNDIFIGFLHAGNLQEEDINFANELSLKYPNKIIELGCHPGFESEELKRKYKNWGNYNWQKELQTLKAN